MMVASIARHSGSCGMARRSMVPSTWSRRSYSRKSSPKYVFHGKKLAVVVESVTGTRSAIGMSRMTATEGPAKGLLLLEREELKGSEGPEEEKPAMTEAVVVVGGGSGGRRLELGEEEWRLGRGAGDTQG